MRREIQSGLDGIDYRLDDGIDHGDEQQVGDGLDDQNVGVVMVTGSTSLWGAIAEAVTGAISKMGEVPPAGLLAFVQTSVEGDGTPWSHLPAHRGGGGVSLGCVGRVRRPLRTTGAPGPSNG